MQSWQNYRAYTMTRLTLNVMTWHKIHKTKIRIWKWLGRIANKRTKNATRAVKLWDSLSLSALCPIFTHFYHLKIFFIFENVLMRTFCGVIGFCFLWQMRNNFHPECFFRPYFCSDVDCFKFSLGFDGIMWGLFVNDIIWQTLRFTLFRLC